MTFKMQKLLRLSTQLQLLRFKIKLITQQTSKHRSLSKKAILNLDLWYKDNKISSLSS